MNILSLMTSLGPKLAEHVTAWGVILAGLAAALVAIGWDLPPFASQHRVEAVESQQREQGITDKATVCILLDVQRTTWELAHERAKADLKKNPDSISAELAKDRAEKKLRGIDRKIRSLGASCPI